MLSDTEVERMFVALGTPEPGRRMVRAIRQGGPVRDVVQEADSVRTRYQSEKMARALYAKSRTLVLPAIVKYEHDSAIAEMWPQPLTVDLISKTPEGRATRNQLTPDLFLVTATGFAVEQWRNEPRLKSDAEKSPYRFYKDSEGLWHDVQAEELFSDKGISYQLRSDDEHPRIFLANVNFLADYSREDTPPVPQEERERLARLLAEHHRIPHLALVHQHGFDANHIFQLILAQIVYSDLEVNRLDLVDQLILYKDRTTARADALLRGASIRSLPSSSLMLRTGQVFVYQGQRHEIKLVGATDVWCLAIDVPGASTVELALDLVKELFEREQINSDGKTSIETEYSLDDVIVNEKKMSIALDRLEAVKVGACSGRSRRTVQRWTAKVRGLTSVPERIEAATPGSGGNRVPRVPSKVLEIYHQIVEEHYNIPSNPPISKAFQLFVEACDDQELTPMSQSSFYERIKAVTNIAAREGRRKAYQSAPIPLIHDYAHPVHGVLPHEVVYVDHTILNVGLKGMRLPDLGKPTLTIALDGALSTAKAFYLSYRPAGAEAVLMLMRDYARRNGRLPRMLTLDNGKEFHSHALIRFCDVFGIHIRWRRRSKPRDSTLVERALGAVEQELISSLDGNTICLKDPRMVSSEVNPVNFISWTLPALHGAIEHYLFSVHPTRIHPRFGMRPDDYEQRLNKELGDRGHLLVRFDRIFKLMTASHSGLPTRTINRQKGVFVDGYYYWNRCLAKAKSAERAEVRVEMWCASVVYVCFRDNWIIAHARDGSSVHGRFRYEVEMQQREESRVRRTAAQRDKATPTNARRKSKLWRPEIWDERLREQTMEAHLIYHSLGMTEVYPEALNPAPDQFAPRPPAVELSATSKTPAQLHATSSSHPSARSQQNDEPTNSPRSLMPFKHSESLSENISSAEIEAIGAAAAKSDFPSEALQKAIEEDVYF